MEGVASEAASLAGHLKLGNLVLYWDDNTITIDGHTDIAFTEDVLARFAAYGWHTESVDDGNDLEALARATEAAQKDDRPSFIRVSTVIGFPAPNKKNTPSAHGSPLGEDEIAATKEIMGWSKEPFFVPEDVAAAHEAIRARGTKARERWEKTRDEWAAKDENAASALQATLAGRLPDGWDDLPRFDADPKGMATRAASGKVIAALAEKVTALVGGSADLEGSNKTKIAGEIFSPEGKGVPRTARWGVREHGMGAAVNGMALFGGVVPFGATFLIFSDYMRPSLRLAALMKLKTRYVFSHDSIGLGEDGPTHQPIEQLAALRAIPGFSVFRPGDANETRESWIAMMRTEGPAAIVLTRQDVPTLDRDTLASAEGVHRGAYVLAETEGAQVTLVGTGSELSLALEAKAKLAEDGVAARVVSMPCWELFGAQDEAYRKSVFPDLPAVVVEAGCRMGWERWTGGRTAFVTLEHFGASAPFEQLYAEFGITTDAVVKAARSLLG